MLLKILGLRKPKFTTNTDVPPQKRTPTPAVQERSPALRIIHAGGLVEQYYMAVPAAGIIEKYPSFVLTRPDVFRRPWDAIVPPEDILIPGQKYFLVPRHTVKKLRRRIKKPSPINSTLFLDSDRFSSDASADGDSFSSNSFGQQTDAKRSGIMIKSNHNKNKPPNRRVRFFGIDSSDDPGSVSSEQGSVSAEMVRKSPNRQGDGKRRRARNIVQWHPTLTSIKENNAPDD